MNISILTMSQLHRNFNIYLTIFKVSIFRCSNFKVRLKLVVCPNFLNLVPESRQFDLISLKSVHNQTIRSKRENIFEIR